MTNDRPSRRLVLGALTALPLAGLPRLAAASAAPPAGAAAPIRFDVRREGRTIGSHTVSFRHDGGDLLVDVDIELAVRLAFVTVYRYRHTNRERWRDGRLLTIDARTDDNGTPYAVRAAPGDGGLRVEGAEGTITVPADTLSTSYWNPATVRRDRLIDTQHGRLAAVSATSLGYRTIPTAAGETRGELFRVSGDLDLDIAYAGDGTWLGLEFAARGAQITYLRSQPEATIARGQG